MERIVENPDKSSRPSQALYKQPTKTVDDIEGYQLHELNQKSNRSQNQNHMGEPLETLAQTMSRGLPPPPSPPRQSQGVPPELRSLTAEVILILVYSAGLIFFSLLLGDVTVPQGQLKEALGISNSELPWLVGAFNVANGLSVIVSGSLMDLTPPKILMVGAFAWLTIWNVIGVFSIRPKTMVLFFIVRAMQGLAVGVLVSGSMSILGRVYKPGLRKNLVFSAMAATAPLGFWLGAIQGGALQAHLKWIFASNAMLSALCCVAHRLWRIRGFTPLMLAYFLGFGSYVGAWQFYAVQFWLHIQRIIPLITALYLLPNAIMGVLATWVVSKTLHRIPGHYIYAASMLAFALGPVFFLPQKSGTTYWPLSFPGVLLVTFGPDSTFAAASIFITSNVPRSYQGSAGSLLVTVQDLSSAIMTSVADVVGTSVNMEASGEVGLKGLRAIWWFGLAAEIVGGLITVAFVRIPREEEKKKEHVT
ncbi:hypothetical protein SI65_08470 [Aspergillus cristatus]|uniref:Major facilitator superfamily (MFS) profile domain-containing protein n=1 Tax=Aspergillus cristatus TaxID=573508 RepID=A0A1E3B6K4_ASPCR|nr:hypothetical protein SI65_08470 [Aspergillus cristatus]